VGLTVDSSYIVWIQLDHSCYSFQDIYAPLNSRIILVQIAGLQVVKLWLQSALKAWFRRSLLGSLKKGQSKQNQSTKPILKSQTPNFNKNYKSLRPASQAGLSRTQALSRRGWDFHPRRIDSQMRPRNFLELRIHFLLAVGCPISSSLLLLAINLPRGFMPSCL
jgi:hypothetical protein